MLYNNVIMIELTNYSEIITAVSLSNEKIFVAVCIDELLLCHAVVIYLLESESICNVFCCSVVV